MIDFEAWLAAEFARRGPFTALVLLVEQNEGRLDPICSCYLNVAGTEFDWGEAMILLSGAGVPWDAVLFFPAEGGILSPVAARGALAALERDHARLAEGIGFDRSGRSLATVPGPA